MFVHLYRTAWLPSVGKELSSWLSALAVLILCRLNCMYSFPILSLRQDVEFDCIGSWPLSFHLLWRINKRVHSTISERAMTTKIAAGFFGNLAEVKCRISCYLKLVWNVHACLTLQPKLLNNPRSCIHVIKFGVFNSVGFVDIGVITAAAKYLF